MVWLAETFHNTLKHQTSCIVPSVKVHRALRIREVSFPAASYRSWSVQWIQKEQTYVLSSGPPESTSRWDTYCQFRWSPVFLNEHMSICILTYDWERVCLNVCLRACHTNHSCVKMTVGDSWGPWTEHRWRSEIRYFHWLDLHCTLTFFSLSFFTNSRTTHTGKHTLLCCFRIR